MKILFDHQIHTLQKYGGISRYFCELMSRFSQDPNIGFSLSLRFSWNEHLRANHRLDGYWSRESGISPGPRLLSLMNSAATNDHARVVLTNLLLAINRRESVRQMKRQDFDLVHPTYYDPYFLRYLNKKPCVVTVYDMIHEIFPENFPPGDPVAGWKRQVLTEADAIIAISESTKRDIVGSLHIDPERIHVVYLGASGIDAPGGKNHPAGGSPGTSSPYILYVGNRGGYKNFSFFIRAVAGILIKNPGLQVCCAGGGPFTRDEMALLRSIQAENRVYFVRADDQMLKSLYAGARAFVFPSLYEGFGLPILEAFSAGCPVLLCNSSSLPEVGGDAARYFDPADPASLTDELECLLTDDRLRQRLITKGYERSREFTWEKTAEATKTIYQAIANR